MGSTAPVKRKAVLVVEDDAIMRLAALDMVEDAGFEPVEAHTAAEAMHALEARPDISVLFADVALPGDMDGVGLAAAVRDRWPAVDIIVISGFQPPSAADLPERAVFFAKPYRERDIVQALRRLAG